MEELTIGEVAQRAGIRASAIRYYESVAVLPAPQRVNGRRCYDASVLERLAVIQLAQQAGFTVAEIRTLFNGFTPETPASARWEALAQQKLAEVDALIYRAQAMKRVLEEQLLRCRCLTLEECARCINDQGPGRNISDQGRKQQYHVTSLLSAEVQAECAEKWRKSAENLTSASPIVYAFAMQRKIFFAKRMPISSTM